MQRLRVGDQVVVISGEEKGKRGKVTRVLKEQNRVVVEGIKLVKRHMRATPQGRPGGILEMEAPIDASKVMLVDPETQKPTRVRHQTDDEGKKNRVGKSGASIQPVTES
jgi:large subunit ribosomal protein L24